MVVGEVLCFIRNNFDKLTISDLKPVLVNYYQEDELLNAKDTLTQAVTQAVKEAGMDIELPRLPKRQGEKKCKQTVDDLLKLYTIVDERKLSDALPRFVAEDLSRVPSVTSDSMNMLAMAKNLEVLEQRMKTVEQLMTKSALETACHTSDSSCDDRLSSAEQLLAQFLHQMDTTAAGTCSGVSADVNTVDSNSLSVSQQLPVCDDHSQKDGPWQTVSYKKLKITGMQKC